MQDHIKLTNLNGGVCFLFKYDILLIEEIFQGTRVQLARSGIFSDIVVQESAEKIFEKIKNS